MAAIDPIIAMIAKAVVSMSGFSVAGAGWIDGIGVGALGRGDLSGELEPGLDGGLTIVDCTAPGF